jgi:HSP20 family molecular chaperone IbpA
MNVQQIPIQTRPFSGDPIQEVNMHIDQLLNTLNQPQVFPQIQPWNPPALLQENEKEHRILVSLAGVKKEDVDISIEGNILWVQGKRKLDEFVDKSASYDIRASEIPMGPFQQSQMTSLRWLRAGIVENNELQRSEIGVPQGGPISVLISNLYLHYALDLWLGKAVKPLLKGKIRERWSLLDTWTIL